MVITPFSVYIHIPFCKKKCPYCSFYVVKDRKEEQALFWQALQREWEEKLPLMEGKKLVSLYFGGGTPTLFPPEWVAAFLRRVETSGFPLDGVEISLEANPEEGELPLFSTLRSIGINRLSIGVQSLDDELLLKIGRAHGAKRAREALFAAEKAGFQNVSIDLLFDLPGQTEESFQKSLEELPHLPIHHLSLYNLTLEQDTPLYRKKNRLTFPSPALSLQLLEHALSLLPRAGLTRYEISAFAKNGLSSRHNLGYWTGRPFLGFGPSAFSYWEGERIRNTLNLVRYAKLIEESLSPIDFRERLSPIKAAQELFLVRLRLTEGAVLSDFPDLPDQMLITCKALAQEEYLEEEKGTIRLTHKGMLFYDTVASELFSV
ncbi:MAG: radical SAM family heme chaperone HemW [Verrucomicrobiota bacterium]|nr:radical SAM family heme chaperone HemW [Verrucomicrobiota bacterium]